MKRSWSPPAMRASATSGCIAWCFSPAGALQGSQVIIGMAPARATRRAQSARKRRSPVSHCWNQLTIRGRAPLSRVQSATAPFCVTSEKLETPR